jgi:NO-binding membrane sensor protein with MHYT domain
MHLPIFTPLINGEHFVYDYGLVILSFVIMFFGSYTFLDMVERMQARKPRRYFWQVSASSALGISISAMHFIGILSAKATIPFDYTTGLSPLTFLIPIVFIAIGLYPIRENKTSSLNFILYGFVVFVGIEAMSRISIASLNISADLSRSFYLQIASGFIGLFASVLILWLCIKPYRVWQRLLIAFILAVVVCEMNYLDMYSVIIKTNLPPFFIEQANGPLAIIIAVPTLTLLILSVVLVDIDRYLCNNARKEAEKREILHLDLESTRKTVVNLLCSASEFRDGDTGAHVSRIAQIAHALAEESGCDPKLSAHILDASALHDIGKIGIPDSILLKPGKLDHQEWNIMKNHAKIGYRLLANTGLPLLDLAAEIAISHHEKWDGSGYPHGLSGEDIPLSGRIVAIADVFDALLSRRPYKEPWNIEIVIAHIESESGRHFDPLLVEIFIKNIDKMVEIRNIATIRDISINQVVLGIC